MGRGLNDVIDKMRVLIIPWLQFNILPLPPRMAKEPGRVGQATEPPWTLVLSPYNRTLTKAHP